MKLGAHQRRIVGGARRGKHEGIAHHEHHPLLCGRLAEHQPPARQPLIDGARGHGAAQDDARQKHEHPRRGHALHPSPG